jgi:hypothetical protein
MYRRRPAPSVKYLLFMLESCDNHPGGGEVVPPGVPGSAARVPPLGERPGLGHPLTLESARAAMGGGVCLTAARRPSRLPGVGSVGFGGQGDVRPKECGEVTLVRAPDLETDVDEWHVGLGQ